MVFDVIVCVCVVGKVVGIIVFEGVFLDGCCVVGLNFVGFGVDIVIFV